MSSLTRKIAFGALAGAVILATVFGGRMVAARDGASQQSQLMAQSLMRQKLEHAQRLLESLSIADYERVVRHAEKLQEISLEARWTQPHSPEYAQYGEDFRNALGRVVRSAEEQNIDGVALNYVQMVLTCVQCHKIVREGDELASLEDGKLPSLLQRQFARLENVR